MKMRILCLIGVLMLAAAAQASTVTLVDIPMNQQIDIGLGDAISPMFGSVLTFEPGGGSEPAGFARISIVQGGGAGGWYYGPYVNLRKAGIGDISIANATFDVDVRYCQGGLNTRPYADAPIFLRAYTLDAAGAYLGHRDYGIFYGPSGENFFPTWSHKVVPLADAETWAYSEGGAFDQTKVAQFRFYGTDWFGAGQDFVDAKNFRVTAIPEPASMLAVVAGLAGVIPFARRRR